MHQLSTVREICPEKSKNSVPLFFAQRTCVHLFVMYLCADTTDSLAFNMIKAQVKRNIRKYHEFDDSFSNYIWLWTAKLSTKYE